MTTKKTEDKNVLDSLLPIITNAVLDWKAAHTEEQITKRVQQLLNQNSQEIVLKLLGFDNKYGGKWEVDHCNGRDGNSAAGDYLRKVQQKAIQDWFDSFDLQDVLSDKDKAAFTSLLKKEIKAAIKNKMYRIAQQKAEEILSAFISDETFSKNVDAYVKSIKLIG